MPVAPMIVCYITGLTYDRERMQNPTFVDKATIRTRKWDPDLEVYLPEQGTAYSIERIMPVPYNLQMKVDIWTTNTEQKLQLFEQIACLFNPAVELQSTDNYLDWGSLSTVELEENTWSSNSIPSGTTDNIDIQSMTFKMPIWISPPAKVKKMGVIFKVISSMFDPNMDLSDFVASDNLLLGTRQAITFGNYGILVLGNEVRILRPTTLVTEDGFDTPTATGSPLPWPDLLEKYGTIQPGISQLRLTVNPADLGNNDVEVIGTIAVNPLDSNVLLFTVDIDTIPPNTFNPVDAIINPLEVAPGLTLPAAALGQRYLLLDAVGNNTDSQTADAWKGAGNQELVANANDIIEFDGAKWIVSFASEGNPNQVFVSNLTTSLQYKWTGEAWVRSWEGTYDPLSWRLVL